MKSLHSLRALLALLLFPSILAAQTVVPPAGAGTLAANAISSSADTLKAGRVFRVAALLGNANGTVGGASDLVARVDSISAGTTDSMRYARFPATAREGDALRLCYRVGKVSVSQVLPGQKDTLWGDQVQTIVVLKSHRPSIRDTALSTREDVSVGARLLTAFEPDSLSWTFLRTSVRGSASITGLDSLVFRPTANDTGKDTMRLVVSNSYGSDTAWVRISIASVNDAPSFVGGSIVLVYAKPGAQYQYPGWAKSISRGPQNESSQRIGFRVTVFEPQFFTVPPAIDTATGAVSFATAPGKTGFTMVQVRLGDNGGTANGGIDSSDAVFMQISIRPLEPISFELGADSLHTYGDRAFSYRATLTGGGAASVFSQDPSVVQVHGDSLRVRGAGTTVLVASGFNADTVRRTIRIAPKPLSVVANPISKTVGAVDPALTYTAGGLAAGDVLVGQVLTGALKRAPGEAVGEYAISQGSLAANANYALTFTGAFFTIGTNPVAIERRAARVPRSNALAADLPEAFATKPAGAGQGGLEPGAPCAEGECLSVELLLPGPATVRVAIADRLGVPVIAWSGSLAKSDLRRLAVDADGRFRMPLRWNLRAQNGVAVSPGIYLWQIEARTMDGQELEEVVKTGVK